MESNPVAVDGVLYTINAPLGQVFAIDAATGGIIWTYTPSYAGEIAEQRAAVQPRPAAAAWPASRSPRARSSSGFPTGA